MKKAKRGRARLAAAAAVVFLLGTSAAAAGTSGENARRLIPLGQAVGIRLASDGVLVVGLSENDALPSPARECGLKAGDVITHINGSEVDSIAEVRDTLQELQGAPMSIRVMRGEQQLQTTAAAVRDEDGVYRLGAWIRDSLAGIGTLTYIDPETGVFGALGHGVNDVDTARLLPLREGTILPAEVSDVCRGKAGEPGELHGVFPADTPLGELFSNTESGIFGRSGSRELLGRESVEVAGCGEIRTGRATILSNVSGTDVEEYEIEITRVCPHSGDGRDLMLTVTDARLLGTTGGIVQGMSGSPILQNGKLVGAVTHVLVNDPTRGYGISMDTMLSACA